jgi:DNA-binding SARP family transcriptional activator
VSRCRFRHRARRGLCWPTSPSRGRPQRRQRLGSLFWADTDDPRENLRWSLTKLRSLLEDGGHKRIVADAQTISLDLSGVEVDLLRVRRLLAAEHPSTEQLIEGAALFRGELLEELDLPDLPELRAWCAAEREEARRLHAKLLRALIERLAPDPAAAIVHARAPLRASGV